MGDAARVAGRHALHGRADRRRVSRRVSRHAAARTGLHDLPQEVARLRLLEPAPLVDLVGGRRWFRGGAGGERRMVCVCEGGGGGGALCVFACASIASGDGPA
jgi:hypothetical protein